jgi:predicted enzyme related to lactoylglutathione lyase
MLKANAVFSSFSVDDLEKAKKFYSETLGLSVSQDKMGMRVKLPGGGVVFVYPKDDHKSATYTVLNFDVDDVDMAVEELNAKGVKFEFYGGITDKNGVARGFQGAGPDIAWFKDPAGNIFSVLHEVGS